MTVKMPEPMTAPMPSAVSDHGPRVFLSACSGSMESLISLSMDLRATSWLSRTLLPGKQDESNQEMWNDYRFATASRVSGLQVGVLMQQSEADGFGRPTLRLSILAARVGMPKIASQTA